MFVLIRSFVKKLKILPTSSPTPRKLVKSNMKMIGLLSLCWAIFWQRKNWGQNSIICGISFSNRLCLDKKHLSSWVVGNRSSLESNWKREAWWRWCGEIHIRDFINQQLNSYCDPYDTDTYGVHKIILWFHLIITLLFHVYMWIKVRGIIFKSLQPSVYNLWSMERDLFSTTPYSEQDKTLLKVIPPFITTPLQFIKYFNVLKKI